MGDSPDYTTLQKNLTVKESIKDREVDGTVRSALTRRF